MRNRLIVSLCIFIACMAITGHMLGQTDNGALAGSVKDSQGAIVPNATITVKNNATGISTTTTPSSSGQYLFPELQAGSYAGSVTARGFATLKIKDVILEANVTTSLPIIMELGSVSQSLTVNASSTQVQTESSEIGTTITPNLLNNFPINSGTGMRSPLAVLYTVPGVTGGGDLSNFKIAGGQVESSDFMLDGATINSVTGGAGGVYSPDVEAVTEVSILLAGMPAQYGRTTGGVLNMVTKSGTNAYHGVVYDILRNEALDANSWFSNHYKAQQCIGDNNTTACRSGFATPRDRKNDIGVTLGGPVRIPKLYNGTNKTFFFFAYEENKTNTGALQVSSVPTLANRAGDFSANLNESDVLLASNPCDNGNPVYAGEIFDPTTTQTINGVTCRSPFRSSAGVLNVISTPISTVAANVMQYWPAPNFPSSTTTSQLNNYQMAYNQPTVAARQTIRIDHSFSPTDSLFVVYDSNSASSISGAPGVPGAGGFQLENYNATRIYRVGYDHVFSNAQENHLNVGVERTPSHGGQATSDPSVNYAQKLGIANLIGNGSFPYFYVGEGIDSLGPPSFDRFTQTGVDVSDDLSWVKGKHSIRFGYNIRYFEDAESDKALQSGEYIFERAETAANPSLGAAAISGNSFASFYLGEMNVTAAQYLTHVPLWKNWYQAVYAQDNYKVLPSLMINAGIRYSVDQFPRESDNDSSIFSPDVPNPGAGGLPGALIFAGTGPGRSGLSSAWVKTYLGDIAPRVGFSWSPPGSDDKTAIRGSYGIMYGQAPNSTEEGGGITQNGFTNTGYYSDSNSVGGFSGVGFNLDAAFPAIPTTPNLNPSQSNGTASVGYVQKDAKPAMVQIWNLQLQQQLATDLLFSIGYTGNHATRLPSDLGYINSLPEKYWSMGSALSDTVCASGCQNPDGVQNPYPSFYGTVANALRPYPQYLQLPPAIESIGQSSYDALWVELQRRFHNGLTLQSQYTWSKTITDADYLDIQYFSTGAVQNPFDLKGEKALSYQDQPQNLTIDWVYDLPFGKNQRFLNHSSLLNAVVGGWRYGGALTYESSFPTTFGCAGSIPGTDNCVRWNHVGNTYKSKAAQGKNFNPDTDNYWLNPGQTVNQVFTNPNANVSTTVGYALGDVPKFVGTGARGPFTATENMNIAKSFPILKDGRAHAQLRFEAFNVFNRHYFGIGDSGPNDPAFGKVTSVSGPRQMQVFFQITY